MMMMNVDFNYLQVHLLWFCEEARQKILCFFFLSFPKFLSLPSLRLSFLWVGLSLKRKRKKARIFVQRRVENIVKTRARVSLGAFQPLFCFRKEYFYAINDRNRYENVRAVSIQGQFARLIFPLLLKLILVVEVSFYAAIEWSWTRIFREVWKRFSAKGNISNAARRVFKCIDRLLMHVFAYKHTFFCVGINSQTSNFSLLLIKQNREERLCIRHTLIKETEHHRDA